MPLIKSISGIRGTVGGSPSENLTPPDILKYTAAFAYIIRKYERKENIKIIVGRDARISGSMVSDIVKGTLTGLGVEVFDIGLASTPTTEMAVVLSAADGGIIITASHNPKQWNALKLLNGKGEFLSAQIGAELLELAEDSDASFSYKGVEAFKAVVYDDSFLHKHIDLVVNNPFVDVNLIRKANFKVAVDAINSVGGIAIPQLLKALGVNNIIKINCNADGDFAHNPEPLPENLTQISNVIKDKGADIGFVVDPDVDRLAIVNEDGTMFGEEYTLVAISDYILSKKKGNTVSNLSSTRALRDVTLKYGCEYSAAAVGEVNVVEKMKETNAIIGGEGNGGVIFPELHYGRDALIGIALFLTHLAEKQKKCSELRAEYPNYYISKNKLELSNDIDVDEILSKITTNYSAKSDVKVNTIDGVKIDFEEGWVHLRKSNTEPIVRIYAESESLEKANSFAELIKKDVESFLI